MRPRVVISTPSARNPKWKFVLCLLDLITHGPHDADVGFNLNASSSLCANRHGLVRRAQVEGFSHILWVDDDMTFPPDLIARMLAHKLPIIACNPTTRRKPADPVAIRDGARIKSAGKTGLEEVDAVGFGVVMTETAIFSKLPLPWFATPFDPSDLDHSYGTEDLFFCKLARFFGYKVMIDHDLSQQIGHCGEYEYTHADVPA